jgi:Protein of unknown function (DUF2844)
MARTLRRGFAMRARLIALATIAAAGALLTPAAQAGLGKPVESVQRDHAALHGVALAVTPMQNYDLHESTIADGTRLRQYATRAGTVFAVAWSGPALPDLKLVLGESYDAYVAAASNHRGSHHVFTIATPELVLGITKHLRGFTGHAHLPALLPAGTTAQELR